MARALAEALRSRGARQAEDAAVRALARRLATLLDESAPRSTYTEPLLLLEHAVDRYDGDHVEETRRALRRVRDALGQHSVASDLGPKYLAVLTSLGLTPATSSSSEGVTGGGKLDELRDRRRRRTRAD
jgi:hypothetical protein